MSSNKCSKGSRSGAHGPARRLVTERNKARRQKKYLRKMQKRWDLTEGKAILALAQPKVIHKKKNPGPNNMGHERRDLHDIRFRDEEDGKVKIVNDLTIEGCNRLEYSGPKKDDGPTGVVFITKAGKKWFLPFTSFSFIIPPKVAA